MPNQTCLPTTEYRREIIIKNVCSRFFVPLPYRVLIYEERTQRVRASELELESEQKKNTKMVYNNGGESYIIANLAHCRLLFAVYSFLLLLWCVFSLFGFFFRFNYIFSMRKKRRCVVVYVCVCMRFMKGMLAALAKHNSFAWVLHVR